VHGLAEPLARCFSDAFDAQFIGHSMDDFLFLKAKNNKPQR
jgi:hypothetical protein